MIRALRFLALGVLGATLGCGPGADEAAIATEARDITLEHVDPGLLLPGSTVVLGGSCFVPDFAGPSRLRLEGSLDGRAVKVSLPARFVDYDRMEVDWPGGLEAGLPAEEGVFVGSATVVADNQLDALVHRSRALALTLALRGMLVPSLGSVQNETMFVNDPVVAHGDGFLLGGSEGRTVARIQGCFTLAGETSCTPVGPTEIDTEPFTPFDRSRAVFPFSPYIAGIRPGHFNGEVRLINRHGPEAGGVEQESDVCETANDIVEPAISAVTPAAASLGQYLEISGGGFVGAEPGQPEPTPSVTSIVLAGFYTPAGGEPASVSLGLVGVFVSGQKVRYALSEEDELGQLVDLRHGAGTLSGTAQPVVEFGADTVSGSPTAVTIDFVPVKQMVWLRFLPTYVESLRHFGLRAAEQPVRERILAVARRDFEGVNLVFTTEEPTDFAWYSEVEVGGPDPNGLGLLGYDNTPGKDDGNLRLYDKIGGINAVTQLDGFPGYGGVFVDSVFGFSQHPGGYAAKLEGSSAVFDQLFDPFRPDVGGTPVGVDELGSIAPIDSSASCPAKGRAARIGCAVWALGSLVGTTVSHEVAHAVGLGDPGGPALHNSGDFPGALMDAGDKRPFAERAEVAGQAPGVFCVHDYGYLRQILPTAEPDPLSTRPECF